jgi:hypothetical protein
MVDVNWRDAVPMLRELRMASALSTSFGWWGVLDARFLGPTQSRALLLQYAESAPATLCLQSEGSTLFLELERKKYDPEELHSALHHLECYAALLLGRAPPVRQPASWGHLPLTKSQGAPSGSPTSIASR